ncbi:MAG: tRNA uridine-5-carboxymethylaminomethyl(34) synthesis GTPase MnmE [Clostridia bacterium]|nr:tRNA uridine-5-carboxymethylaminomethyl(34) synthesis GTPase MnmE [Clostridia bacterium]
MEKTIAAISTPPGTGGISVIRISGPEAVSIADSIFSGSLVDASTHTAHYGFIEWKGERIDEVIVTVMRAPKTFTREDVVEIGTHGGIIVTNMVLDVCIKAGAYPAAPGEFTKRAFINGRIDLAGAEAVIDIINSENVMAEKNAAGQLRGRLSRKIEEIRQSLVDLAAHMQVAIDYPDEELEDITLEDIESSLKLAEKEVSSLIRSADDGRIIKEGIKTVIAGKPNVGKSTLLNCLSGFEKAIVTDIAGTTRDIIEEQITLAGIPIRLTDTAGIRETDDKIEKIGVERSKESIADADLVLAVINADEPLDAEDREIFERTEGKKRIVVANKTDKGICDEIKNLDCIFISAKDGSGTEELVNKISALFAIGDIKGRSGEIITNMRHKAALESCRGFLMSAGEAVASGMPQDIASIDINSAIDSLGEITGATVSEDIVNSVFSNFCVGK